MTLKSLPLSSLVVCCFVVLVVWFGVVFVVWHFMQETLPKTAQADLCISCINGGSTRAKKTSKCRFRSRRSTLSGKGSPHATWTPKFSVVSEDPKTLSGARAHGLFEEAVACSCVYKIRKFGE